MLIEDTYKALHVLRRLSAKGVKIALDDFGTGYASLSYLQTFQFDKIKIDRSFIMDLEVNFHSRAIVDAVLGMCEAIGIPVIAEGLESAMQVEMLKAKGCNYGQGYFLSYPLKDARSFLTQKSWLNGCQPENCVPKNAEHGPNHPMSSFENKTKKYAANRY